MKSIHELIAELCPNGVEYMRLDSLVSYEQPTKYIVKKTDYDVSFETPVLTAGDTFILGYTNETEGIYPASKQDPRVIFDDFTTSFKWVDFKFKVKSSAMKILKVETEATSLRYVYYAMSCIRYFPGTHARQWISTFSKIKIPVPPLEVQHEIVRILDEFTQLQAELEAELEARRQQYEYYRDQLLTFPEIDGGGVSHNAT